MHEAEVCVRVELLAGGQRLQVDKRTAQKLQVERQVQIKQIRTMKPAGLGATPHLGAQLRDGALALRGLPGAHQRLHVHGRPVPVQGADIGDTAPPCRHAALPGCHTLGFAT